MKKNFKIYNQSSLELNNNFIFDLHNIYGLIDYKLNLQENILILSWKKELYLKSDRDVIPEFSLFFFRIKHFKISVMDQQSFPKFVDTIGYKPPNDRDYDYLLYEEDANDESHLTMSFQEDVIFRIYSDEVSLTIN